MFELHYIFAMTDLAPIEYGVKQGGYISVQPNFLSLLPRLRGGLTSIPIKSHCGQNEVDIVMCMLYFITLVFELVPINLCLDGDI